MEPKTPDVPTASLSRRDLLATSATAAAGIALATCACSLSGCQAQSEKGKMVTTGTVNIGPASNFPAGTANTDLMSKYGITIVNDSGPVLAIRPKCTHKGCIAPWNAEKFRFVCPCHGSEFNLLGEAVKGPATKSLPEVVAEKQPNGSLTVDLDKLYAQ